ncbi:CHASE2 domain-containing protein [Oculatella sp. LEGE 06141]|uniref:CHASE2 domain-containing protein n=1 Tax=Oculatella sp. LEGE 06141 TaxID=1828648 RepID=UPI001882D0AA|nr:CHASE2 domain-containing protein [Oculatella sp. LEGE 06141]MBE9178154.1 CHASE2 domain-containing protein [Oculatella sp. LEGE 06141]
MSQLVVLNFTQGNLEQGCPTAIAQLWQGNSATPMQFLASLPPAPELDRLYQRWQRLYAALYAYKGWQARSAAVRSIEIDDDDDDITQISEAEFYNCGHEVQQAINTWLGTASFAAIDRQLRTYLTPDDEIRCIFTAVDRALLQLPWHLWQFFEDYPNAELALSLPEYSRAARTSPTSRSKVNILAILGDQQNIDLERDRQLLQDIPDTNLKLLIQPDVQQFTEHLWQQGWDLLFFAGHSSSQGKGRIHVNPTTSLTIEQLRYGLKRAIASGLKLAIFNSCDGLGLAWDLADLQIPQVIAMREPVPDRVAQEFLKSFLLAFSTGQSLYASVRQAREQLQALETDFPGATWLPVLCQNPAEVPQSWQEWSGRENATLPNPELRPRNRSLSWRGLLAGSLLVTGCLLGVRSLGLLQPAELWAFDRLLSLRPLESPDDRFLIVTIDEADIQAQNASDRRGSLSDAALNQALIKLQPARVIGLDVYRDFASNLPPLAERLRDDRRLFVVCKRLSGAEDAIGIAPPPEIPAAQVGFSDFLTDDDGVLRRHLMLMSPDSQASCAAPYAFNMQLVFSYLDKAEISAHFNADGNLQFGDLVLHRLQDRAGGYQSIDARGNQLLLNYRSRPLQAIAPSVSLTQLLKGEVSSAQIQDRIVLIGVTAVGSQDVWSTPYGSGRSQQVSGVFLQAQMASQILSAVLDRRSLLSVWPQWAEGLWIWIWTLANGVFIKLGRSRLHQGLILLVVLSGLTGTSMFLLVEGIWVPLFPASLGVLALGGAVSYGNANLRK